MAKYIVGCLLALLLVGCNDGDDRKIGVRVDLLSTPGPNPNDGSYYTECFADQIDHDAEWLICRESENGVTVTTRHLTINGKVVWRD